MATFASVPISIVRDLMLPVSLTPRCRKSTFSAASYATFRPTYPASLYQRVMDYHKGAKTLCLDLGCGPGIATREMGTRFTRAIGTDPSAGMIAQAQKTSAETKPPTPNISYQQSSAESIPFLESGSVDCIVAAQAAHWFDFSTLWPEMARLLRPGGTLAFWGYKDPALVDFPRATDILNRHTYGEDPETLGPYWTMPGRRYVQEQLRVLQPPETEFEEVHRVEYEPKCEGARSGEGTIFMEKELTVAQAKDYYRTWSSFHGWQEAHPGQVARSKGGEGDLMDRMVDLMAEDEEVFRDESNMVRMEWGSALVMARRKE